MPDNTIRELLQKYRYDGKRFWFKDARGRWGTSSAKDIKLSLAVGRNIPMKQAATLRDSLKAASKTVHDPEWLEEVRWLDFIKGRQLCVGLFGTIEFCDRSSNRSTRSMKIADFNKKLRNEFPSKGQVPEDSSPGFLLL
jgi:hypothetical protein